MTDSTEKPRLDCLAASDFVMSGAAPSEVRGLVEAFHYSARMPGNIQHCYAVRSVGGLFGDYGTDIWAAAIFSIPPTRWAEPVLELSRLVRHPNYKPELSEFIGFSCRWLKRSGCHLVVSFADWTHRHHGGVYQASGWNYSGCRDPKVDGVVVDGQFIPGRSCNSRWGTRSPSILARVLPEKTVSAHWDDGKHLYWRALSVAGKTRAKRLRLKSIPYPKPDNAGGPLDEPAPAGASAVQPREPAPRKGSVQ